jgi:hypothetical protein
MSRRTMFVGVVAALSLAVFGFANWPTADAAGAAKAKQALGCGCCCEDPACPPGCSADCPPDCDLVCRQTLGKSARPLCPKPVVSMALLAKSMAVAPKSNAVATKCGPNGCCTAACDFCPPCPFCP